MKKKKKSKEPQIPTPINKPYKYGGRIKYKEPLTFLREKHEYLLDVYWRYRGIEPSRSDRSHCSRCGERIGKGVPRLSWWSKKTTAWSRTICRDCCDEYLDNDIKQMKEVVTKLKRIKTQMKRLTIKCKDAIDREEISRISDKL